MIDTELTRSARQLEAKITAASSDRRLELQPELGRIIDRLKRDGHPVPARLRNLNASLLDEAIEQRFDNLPI